MIKHFLEALYLPYTRSNDAKWNDFSSGANIVFVLLSLIILLAWGLGLPAFLVNLWPDRLALDSLGVIIPFLFAADYLIRLVSFREGYIDTGLGVYLTLPIKRRSVFWFTFVRYCTADKTMGWQPMLFVASLMLITPVYGAFPTIAWLAVFYVWTLINNLLASEIGRTQYKVRLHAVILGVYGLWTYFSLAKGIVELPIRAICESWSLYLFLTQIVLFYAVARLYLWYKSYSRYDIIENGAGKTLSLKRWFEFAGMNSVFKMRLRSFMVSEKSAIILFLIFPVFSIVAFKYNWIGFGNNSIWLYYIPFCYVINLGRFSFALESNFFDRIATLPYSVEKILRTDYIFYNLFQMLIFIAIILICNNINTYFVLSLALFSAGPVSAITFYMAAVAVYKVDTAMRVQFQNNGVNLKAIISLFVSMFVLATPAVVEALSNQRVAILYMAISGTVFTLASPYWIKLAVRRFNKNKYDNLIIFREKI